MLASLTSRDDIHRRTAKLIEKVTTPGKHHERLSDWPFRVVATTNYDHLIEVASRNELVAIGNRGAELHKITGGARGVVTDEVIADRLRVLGVATIQFDGWAGWGQEHLVKREDVQREIGGRRSRQGTYKHDRQTQAEAEVAIIVDGGGWG